MVVEAWRPNKKDALKYIDLDGQRPDQYARVSRKVQSNNAFMMLMGYRSLQAIISHGSFTPPVIKDYLIGPLPITPLTHIRPLSEIYTNPDIPFNGKYQKDIEESGIDADENHTTQPVYSRMMMELPSRSLWLGRWVLLPILPC
jgi:primary-amine oxidase